MKDRPISLVLINIFGLVSIFAYIERIFEMKIQMIKQGVGEYDNNIWMTIITVFTIGYGDYYPKVFFGKVMAVIVTFTGVYLISIFVIGATSILELTDG